MTNQLAKNAYDILEQNSPNVIRAINGLITLGETREEIMQLIKLRRTADVFEMGLIEMAIEHCFYLQRTAQGGWGDRQS